MTRIYQAGSLEQDTFISLDDRAAHYLRHVLRVRVGDKLTLFNGEGGEYPAEIVTLSKKEVVVKLGQFLEQDVESPLDICLAQGIARGEKMDWIIQKAVELGVKEIVPLITERCNVKLDVQRQEKRWLHWQSVMISACEQSGRNRLPILHQPQDYADWLHQAEAAVCLVLTPHQSGSLPDQKNANIKSALLLIGPEGGLSDAEVFQAMQKEFKPLQLGPRILRTETAPLAAISILQYCFGDLSRLA